MNVDEDEFVSGAASRGLHQAIEALEEAGVDLRETCVLVIVAAGSDATLAGQGGPAYDPLQTLVEVLSATARDMGRPVLVLPMGKG
jgi:hypothetical protein